MLQPMSACQPAIFWSHFRHFLSDALLRVSASLRFIVFSSLAHNSGADNILRSSSYESSHIHDGSFQQPASGLLGCPSDVRSDKTVPRREEGIVLNRWLDR